MRPAMSDASAALLGSEHGPTWLTDLLSVGRRVPRQSEVIRARTIVRARAALATRATLAPLPPRPERPPTFLLAVVVVVAFAVGATGASLALYCRGQQTQPESAALSVATEAAPPSR
jgi:hypothetical protein